MKDLGMKPGHIIKLKLNPGSNNLWVMLIWHYTWTDLAPDER